VGLEPSLQLASPFITDGGHDDLMGLPLCLDILIPPTSSIREK